MRLESVLRHTRATIMWLTSRCAPSLRVLQCVAPPAGTPCRFQNPRFQFRGEHRGELSQMPAVESAIRCSANRLLQLATKPGCSRCVGHFIPGMAFGQQQNQPRPSGIFGPIGPAVGSPCQFYSSEFVNVIASLMDAIIVYIWLLQPTRSKRSLTPIERG